nr:hypothetical protein [Tanacetum cinerariifolium]
FNTTARNPIKEILFKLNLPDHMSILTDSKVTPTKHGRMTKPYFSSRFIANYFISGIYKVGHKDDKEEEYVRTLKNYESTDDEYEHVDEEEYKELYKDVNVRLKDVEHGEEGKGDAEKTDAGHDDVTQETTYEQVNDDEHVTLTTVHDTQKTEIPLQKLSELKQADHSAQLLKAIKSQIYAMVDAHLGTRLGDFIQKAFQSYTAKFKKKAQDEKKRYIDLIEKSVKDIINDEVKTQQPQILPKVVSDFANPLI